MRMNTFVWMLLAHDLKSLSLSKLIYDRLHFVMRACGERHT